MSHARLQSQRVLTVAAANLANASFDGLQIAEFIRSGYLDCGEVSDAMPYDQGLVKRIVSSGRIV